MDNRINQKGSASYTQNSSRERYDSAKALREAHEKKRKFEEERRRQFGKANSSTPKIIVENGRQNTDIRRQTPRAMQNPQPRQSSSVRETPKRPMQSAPMQTHIAMPADNQRKPVNFQNSADVSRYRQNQQNEQRAKDLQKRLGKVPDPKAKIQKSRGEAETQRTRNAPPKQNKPQPKKKAEQRQNSGWAIPEGSPIYTTEGVIYENPTSRQRVQRTPRKKLTKAQIEELKRREFEEQKRKEREALEKRDKILYHVKSFAIRFVVFLVLFSALVFFRYRAVYVSNGSSANSVTYTFVDTEGNENEVDVSSSNAWKDGTLYINFSDIADWLDMASVGSIKNSRFVFTANDTTSAGTGDEESVKFTNGKKIAVINGTSIVMENTCRISGKNVWVPLSFAEYYINGIEIDTDKKGNSEFNLIKTDEGTFEELSFRLKGSSPLESVEYSET